MPNNLGGSPTLQQNFVEETQILFQTMTFFKNIVNTFKTLSQQPDMWYILQCATNGTYIF